MRKKVPRTLSLSQSWDKSICSSMTPMKYRNNVQRWGVGREKETYDCIKKKKKTVQEVRTIIS